MPQDGIIFRILIASPSDCVHERKIIPEVINSWNAINSMNTGAIIEPVMWETHTRPEMGDRPQGIVNRQIVDNCDILVGTFWTRFGTPTGEADSGTVEEIERFREEGKPVMLYFSSVPVIPESIDPEQYESLTNYRNQLQEEGLIWTYESISDLRGQFQRHLSSQMTELLKSNGQRFNGNDINEPAEDSLIEFRSILDSFIRRFSVEWSSERDSDPMGIDDGKFILDNAFQEVINLRPMVARDEEGVLSQPLDEIAQEMRRLSRHRIYMDGGASFNEFWERGDKVIDRLNDVLETVDNIIDEESDS